jgi:Cu2+-containing amine oxidase
MATKSAKKSAKSSARAPVKSASKAASQAPAKVTKTSQKASAPNSRRTQTRVADIDPSLFEALSPGETADAIRTLTEDRRVAAMAKIARYRVVCTEPLVVKPPHWMAGHRLARIVIYDYAADRCVDACVDLDAGVVAHLDINQSQPMLSREEEAIAITIAAGDEQVRAMLALDDSAQLATHYWGKNENDLAYGRRSAAVVFGRAGGHPSLVAVVDLIDNMVTNVVPAEQW